MPAFQYPFIDIAVHERVRGHFAAGEAAVLFSPDMDMALWANGRGADLFGFSSIYDFLDQGPVRSDVTFRQAEAAALQLVRLGDRRELTIRITEGFQRVAAKAVCELIEVQGEPAILFTAAVVGGRLSAAASAARMIEGLGDPDTHIAVVSGRGETIARSRDFNALELSEAATARLAASADYDTSRVAKRPLPTARGFLPAAIGKLADEPALYLLVVVEPSKDEFIDEFAPAPAEYENDNMATSSPDALPQVAEMATDTGGEAISSAETDGFEAAMSAVAAIEDEPEPTEEITVDVPDEVKGSEAAQAIQDRHEIETEVSPAADDRIEQADDIEGHGKDDRPAEPETAELVPETIPDVAADPAGTEMAEGQDDAATATASGGADDEAALHPAADPLLAIAPVEDAPAEDAEGKRHISPEPAAGNEIAHASHDQDALQGDGFSFKRDGRAVRFVWKIDSHGHFTEISPEFAQCVGPHAADIIGMAFADLAILFNLDPSGKITELLGKRDTWSGKTIYWPVEASELRVPVDLAALPTYTRSREFDGFRGFGIVRVADAIDDPQKTGLTFGANAELDDTGLDEASEAIEDGLCFPPKETDAADNTVTDGAALVSDDHGDDVADANDLAADDQEDGPLTDLPEPSSAASSDLDWPPGERPALRIVENPGRRHSDKVIRFDERRAQLSVGERAAFQEIARQLDRFTGKPIEPPANDDSAEQPENEISETGRIEDATAEHGKDEAASGETSITPDGEPTQPLSASLESHHEADDENSETVSDQAETMPEDGGHTAEHDAAVDNAAADGPAASPVDENQQNERADTDTDVPARELSNVPAEVSASPEEPGLAEHDQQTDEDADIVDAETSASVASEPVVAMSEQAGDVARGDASHPAIVETEGRTADPAPANGPLSDVNENHEHATAGNDGDFDTVQKPDTAVEAAPEPTERELLSRMMPGRERIGLSPDIIDQMPVALLVHSGDVLIHGNPEFLRLTGYGSIDELSDIGGLDALLQRQELEGKTADASGMVVVRADDEIVPVTARLQSVRWEDSSALMLALMPVAASTHDTDAAIDVKDIPLRPMIRPADQIVRLQVEVDEMRAILETATDGVVIIDGSGEIRSMNRSASGLFNYDAEEVEGRPFVVLFAHESHKAVLDYLGGLSDHGVASVLNDGREVIGREASGGFLPLFMTIGKLTSSNGYCAVIRDITQWKRTEDELRTAKRAAETANAHKSDFLAHVSHEIRTPLNAIIGFSDMMASERFGPIGHPRYIEYANDIGRSGRHVLDIVNDLLDISKIEAGEMEMDFVAVGLNETVSEAVSLVQPQANGQRVIIRTALSNAVPQVVADLRSVKQIVLNVLSNAIRFTPSGGQIVVSTGYEANGSVVLRIRDTGIGMSRAELELAMKPFRQVPGGTRARGDGTGLGLPLTKAMVDANRAIFAISSETNEGTLVEITFPSQRVLAN
jgi:PAS domain S-box-containing protein